jgi:hypothetical protein
MEEPMFKRPSAGSVLLTAALMTGALSSAACNRGAEETIPVAEMRGESPITELERPVSVTGCLRGGEAPETFVLTTSRADDADRTTTYALNLPPEMQARDVRDHVGEQVAIEGIVRSQQAIAGYTRPAPAAGQPVGTAGEPTVQTTTELAVDELQVNQLRPLGEPCLDDR